jgi:hypothetical protein
VQKTAQNDPMTYGYARRSPDGQSVESRVRQLRTLSTRTHGSSCRRRPSSSLRRVSSFSALSSSSRTLERLDRPAADHETAAEPRDAGGGERPVRLVGGGVGLSNIDDYVGGHGIPLGQARGRDYIR